MCIFEKIKQSKNENKTNKQEKPVPRVILGVLMPFKTSGNDLELYKKENGLVLEWASVVSATTLWPLLIYVSEYSGRLNKPRCRLLSYR